MTSTCQHFNSSVSQDEVDFGLTLRREKSQCKYVSSCRRWSAVAADDDDDDGSDDAKILN